MAKAIGKTPKKSRFSLDKFEEALHQVENRREKQFYQHVCEQAFKDNKVMLAVLNKLLANKIEHNKIEQTNIMDMDWVSEKLTILSDSDKSKIRPEVEQYLN